ncbi:MAG: hypothetical protein K5657_06285 [Desulfovibrio sp.]|nr:hypothetical protein [Desulfovibrio sp.]
MVVMEELQAGNMSRSASGLPAEAWHTVRAKRGLNKSIPDQGLPGFRRQPGCNLTWFGRTVLLVPQQYISRTCGNRGFADNDKSLSRAVFNGTSRVLKYMPVSMRY